MSWAEIGVIVLSIHTVLKAIVRVTKTQVDDNIVAKLEGIIKYLFGIDPKPKSEG